MASKDNLRYSPYFQEGKHKVDADTSTKSSLHTPAVSQSPVKSPAYSPVKQPANSPVKQPSNSPVKQPANSPVKLPAYSPVKQPANLPVKSTMKNTSPMKSPSKRKKLSDDEKDKRLHSPDKKLGGLTEDYVRKLVLPDHLKENLDIIFCGINPGLVSAYKGHHYCGNNNHFWPLLYDSGLIGQSLTWKDDFKCLDFNIGMTNIVARTTRSAAELSKVEIKAGKDGLMELLKRLKPLVLCFNGKGSYEIFSGVKKCEAGRQCDILDVAVYVMPSTSGLVAQYPRKEDKLKFFIELKQLRDEMKEKINLV